MTQVPDDEEESEYELVEIDIDPDLSDLIEEYQHDLHNTLVSCSHLAKGWAPADAMGLLLDRIGALTASYMREACGRVMRATAEALGHSFGDLEVTLEDMEDGGGE